MFKPLHLLRIALLIALLIVDVMIHDHSQESLFTNVASADPDDDDDIEDEIEDDIDDDIDDMVFSDAMLESILSLDEISSIDGFDTLVDDVGNIALSGEILMISDAAAVERLKERGYRVRSTENLSGIGQKLVKLEPPVSFEIADVRRDIQEAAPDADVDLNHLFSPESVKRRVRGDGIFPSDVSPVSSSLLTANLRIGMIDTSLRTKHVVFKNSDITERDFVPFEFKKPVHGTSVASILVGKSSEYQGLLPDASLFAASVFFKTPSGNESATTESLIQAINWLVENDVKVINMSLAGPENEVLERTINEAYKKGVLIVAAVGNGGPKASPLYPAAYDTVIAVTAIDQDRGIYRRANRGEHVDFAAHGVAIRNARGKKKFQNSTGTSFATPFATAVIAVNQNRFETMSEAVNFLEENAIDLGDQGYDEVFGHGLIHSPE